MSEQVSRFSSRPEDQEYASCVEQINDLLGGPIAPEEDVRAEFARSIAQLIGLSAVTPNYSGYYAGRRYAPNQFATLIGPAGSNKSVISSARHVTANVHRRRLAESERELVLFEEEALSKKPAGLIVAADASSAALVDRIAHHKWDALIVSPELDAGRAKPGESWKDLSVIQRQAFEHESIEIVRMERAISIESPRLSMVGAGTPGAFLRVIPTIEDGTFSRHLWLMTEVQSKWRSPKPRANQRQYGQNLLRLQLAVDRMAKAFEKRKRELDFQLSDSQWRVFDSYFESMKSDVANFPSGESLFQVVHRLGVIAFRLAMTVSAARVFLKDPKAVGKVVNHFPSDDDLQLALDIVRIGFYNAVELSALLPTVEITTSGDREERLTEFLHQLPDRCSRMDAVEAGNLLFGLKPRTVDLYLRKLVDRKHMSKPKPGVYIKNGTP